MERGPRNSNCLSSIYTPCIPQMYSGDDRLDEGLAKLAFLLLFYNYLIFLYFLHQVRWQLCSPISKSVIIKQQQRSCCSFVLLSILIISNSISVLIDWTQPKWTEKGLYTYVHFSIRRNCCLDWIGRDILVCVFAVYVWSTNPPTKIGVKIVNCPPRWNKNGPSQSNGPFRFVTASPVRRLMLLVWAWPLATGVQSLASQAMNRCFY